MERVCSHLITAIGRAFAKGEISEAVALARLACDEEGEFAAACAEIKRLLDAAEDHDGPPPPGRSLPRSLNFLLLALGVARLPQLALPAA